MMMSPEGSMFCQLDSAQDLEREQQRLRALAESGLLEAESIPVFEEAVQMTANFLDAPICILGIMDQDRQFLKSAVGLSRIGLMNDLASSRQLPREESLCDYVVNQHQAIALSNTTAHPVAATGLLVHQYGIQSYLGVPLLDSQGYCLGTLAIMGLEPRNFNTKEIEFLELMARWSMSEYERDRLLRQQQLAALSEVTEKAVSALNADTLALKLQNAQSTKVDLMSYMTQELRTPLTSILGMASVLGREIYGPLTEKQKEYLGIVHHSGQYLLSLVNEIVELGILDDVSQELNLSPVDIEMLCQQALATLEHAAQRREQKIHLTVEPGHRIWLLDKDKVRQMLYHLVFRVIQVASADSIVRVHVSRKQKQLNIMIWPSHTWLGEGLPQSELTSMEMLSASSSTKILSETSNASHFSEFQWNEEISFEPGSVLTVKPDVAGEQDKLQASRQNLSLMLSRQLIDLHGGSISIQGSVESGHRYVISLPQVGGGEE